MRRKASEAALFEFFLRLRPEFAGEKIQEWTQPNQDPPDILCRTESGKLVGVELTAWLDERQMATRKRVETIEQRVLIAVGDQPENRTRHLGFVWLHLHQRVRMQDVDDVAFRQELFAAINTADESWRGERWARSTHGMVSVGEYPTLSQAVRYIQCCPRPEGESPSEGIPWITFPCPGGFFNSGDMVAALKKRLTKKREKYRSNAILNSLAQAVLIIHYDQALIYNTPVETPHFKFVDAIEMARVFLGGDAGCFSRIFVLIALEPGGQVIPLYP